MTTWNRRWNCIHALARLDTSQPLTPSQKADVVDIVRAHHLTREDFRDLDEQPGRWGYTVHIDGTPTSWHWKLRQTRNDPTTNLYAALTTGD